MENANIGEVISRYTRAQAIADGELVDVTKAAKLHFPVAITRAAWHDCCEWLEEDNARKRTATGQSTEGRLHDVLFMLQQAISRATRGQTHLNFQVLRIRRDGEGVMPRLAHLKAICHPGDDAEPVITIMLAEE